MRLSLLTPLLLLNLVLNFSASAQQDIPDVKPLPPNAAALFKVLERPIGTYTGTVPVQFPLCSVNSGQLSASLALSYNGTGGIKVEEAASSVGLGFSLDDGGGRIIQTVRGQPDDMETYNIGRLYNPTKPSNFNCTEMNGDVYTAYYSPQSLDFDPDIFMYNFNGQSGKFFFTEDGKIIMMQKTGIKISYTKSGGRIATWTILDEKGNVYEFGNRQYCDYTYGELGSVTTTTGPSSVNWSLNTVRDFYNNNFLNYTYQSSGELFTSFSGGRMILMPTSGCGGFDLSDNNSIVQTEVSEQIVAKISARSGFIRINASGGRLDSYGIKVDSIMLFTPDSQLVKKYKFNYAYFSVGANMWEKRLYLKSFSEFGSSGTDSLTHTFEYNTQYPLPSRLSFNTDSWGFYNGYGNTSIFPNYVFINGPTQYRRTDLGQKNARSDYAQAGILKKIKYPSGGYREFVYEGNTALISFNPSLYHPDPTNSITRSFNHSEAEWNSNYGFTLPFFTKYFEVNSNDGGTNFKYTLTVPYNCAVQVKLYKTTTANQSTGGTLISSYMTNSFSQTITNGYYRIEFYRDVACWVSGLYASWSECTLSLGTVQSPHYQGANLNENNIAVGGVRIKEIRDYDPVADKIFKTEYKYKLYSSDSAYTSGLLVLQPRYIVGQQPSGVGCFVRAVLAKTSYPLASDGLFVVYPEVRTIQTGSGWTDRIFTYVPDVPPSSYPYIPPVDNSFFRGILKQEKVYNSSGVLLKKTVNNYSTAGTNILTGGLKVSAYWSCPITCQEDWYDHPYQNGISPSVAYCNSYSIRGGATDLGETIDSTFTTSGIIVNRTKYEFDTLYNGRMFLKRILRYLNGGDIRSTTFKYYFTPNAEFIFGLSSNDVARKSELNMRNVLTPMETVDSIRPASGTAVLLGGSKYIYVSSSDGPRLSKVRNYASMVDSVETNFPLYDAVENILERYVTNDITETYIWGYNGVYPVAKITGSNYATASSFINAAVVSNPSSDAAMRAELNKIRTGLSGSVAQVTTYTYKTGVGITSETDPKGKTTFYEYDNLGRLSIVRDQNNNIIKKIEYKLVNPQ